MVVVMVILVALLGAGAVAIYVQVADTRRPLPGSVPPLGCVVMPP